MLQYSKILMERFEIHIFHPLSLKIFLKRIFLKQNKGNVHLPVITETQIKSIPELPFYTQQSKWNFKKIHYILKPNHSGKILVWPTLQNDRFLWWKLISGTHMIFVKSWVIEIQSTQERKGWWIPHSLPPVASPGALMLISVSGLRVKTMWNEGVRQGGELEWSHFKELGCAQLSSLCPPILQSKLHGITHSLLKRMTVE